MSDTGSGMPPEKIERLLAEKESLDGELHSLGFVFVRQTVGEFGGTLEIDSEEGKGTTVTVRFPYLPDAVPPPRQPSRCEKYGQTEEDDQGHVGHHPREAGARPRPTVPPEGEGSWGAAILEDYRASESPHPGSVFAIAVTDDDRVDYFTHRPYERLWGITHEDLSPMFFQATVRGRLEEDEEKRPVLILKAPQNVREYFEFKELPEGERSAEAYNRMVHDEYIRIARKLIASGMDPEMGVLLTDIPKLFPGCAALLEKEPVELQRPGRPEADRRVGGGGPGDGAQGPRPAGPGRSGYRRGRATSWPAPPASALAATSSSMAVVTDFGRSMG